LVARLHLYPLSKLTSTSLAGSMGKPGPLEKKRRWEGKRMMRKRGRGKERTREGGNRVQRNIALT